MQPLLALMLLAVTAVPALGVPQPSPIQLCYGKGWFPDTRDCRISWDCRIPMRPGSVPPYWEHCAESRPAYHPLHQNCSLPSDHPTCKGRPAPRCTGVGRKGALNLNPNILYNCTEEGKEPELYKCPEGLWFDARLDACLDPSSTTDASVPPPWTTPVPPETSTWPPTETTAGTYPPPTTAPPPPPPRPGNSSWVNIVNCTNCTVNIFNFFWKR